MDFNLNVVEVKDEENLNRDLNESNNNFTGNKEVNKLGVGDAESSHSESSKIFESREDRIKRLKEQSESDRQRKLAEIMESQKLSNELRQKQQIERRKKIEELKLREEERRKGVELRRRELDEREKEKNETIQKRNKEREERAARNQKPLRAQVMSSSMSQSMISPRQNRMTTSVHSTGTSSGSEKCMRKASYGRWPSSCDVDRVSSYVSPAAGKACSSNKSRRSASNTGGIGSRTAGTGGEKCRTQPPEGFIEIDGHFIPASTRHVGCFLPYKGPQYRVKGVLAWGPPPQTTPSQHQTISDRGTAVSWWAGLDIGQSSSSPSTVATKRGAQFRASSAHTTLHNDAATGNVYPSIPCRIDHAGLGIEILSPISPRSIKGNIFGLQPDMKDFKEKLSTHKQINQPQHARMVKAFSQHHISLKVELPDRIFGKDTGSSRSKNQSTTRNNAANTLTAGSVSSTITKPATKKPKDDKLLFERLSKPRSGSQPPKIMHKEPGESSAKIMSTSFNKQQTKSEKPPNKDKRKLSTSVISLEPSVKLKEPTESTQTQIVVDEVKDQDASETTNNTTEEISSTSNSGSRRGSKNFAQTPETSAPILGEAEAYKVKLAEQRRIAREKKEEQEQEKRRIEEEARQKAALEKKRIEEETRKFMEEEAQRAKILEEEQLAEIEKQKLLEESERKKKEDAMRELEEKRQEELRLADEERMMRKRKLEMIMRRVKQPDGANSSSNEDSCNESGAAIPPVTDDKKQDSVIELTLQGNSLKPFDSSTRENSPQRTVAWSVENCDENQTKLNYEEKTNESEDKDTNNFLTQTSNISRSNSPEMISETVLNLVGPDTVNSGNSLSVSFPPVSESTLASNIVDDQQPQFKSKLLNSMLNKGRLNSSRIQDDKINLSSNDGMKGKRNSLYVPSIITDDSSSDIVILPHSKSYDSELDHMTAVNGINHNQAINSLSEESEGNSHIPNGDHHNHLDTYNEITLSNSTSNIDPPRLSLEKLELRSESTCSQFSSDDCPVVPGPSMPPHSHALELS